MAKKCCVVVCDKSSFEGRCRRSGGQALQRCQVCVDDDGNRHGSSSGEGQEHWASTARYRTSCGVTHIKMQLISMQTKNPAAWKRRWAQPQGQARAVIEQWQASRTCTRYLADGAAGDHDQGANGCRHARTEGVPGEEMSRGTSF